MCRRTRDKSRWPARGGGPNIIIHHCLSDYRTWCGILCVGGYVYNVLHRDKLDGVCVCVCVYTISILCGKQLRVGKVMKNSTLVHCIRVFHKYCPRVVLRRI